MAITGLLIYLAIGAAVLVGEASNARYGSVRASADTTYVIRPYLNRAVARRGSQANYTLKIERHKRQENSTMIRHSLIVLIGATALLGAVAQAAQPSFKCGKGMHEAEELICQDAGLAKLDNDLSRLYSTLMKRLPASEQKHLRAEQSGWVKGRNDCWKAADPKACIRGEYATRINELKDR